LAFCLAAFLVFAHQLRTLRQYPVFIDEPWTSNVAWNWLRTGAAIDSLHVSVTDPGARGVQLPQVGFLATLPAVVSFRLFGLGLFQARLASWVLGGVLLLATFSAGYRLYGAPTAAIGLLFLALSSEFTRAVHTARPDVMLAAAIMIACSLALAPPRAPRRWQPFAAGLVLGLALDVHPNAIMFAPAIGAIYFQLGAPKDQLRRILVEYALGWLLGLGYYAVVHVLPDPRGFLVLTRVQSLTTHLPPLGERSLLGLVKSAVHEVGRYHFSEDGLGFALIGSSIIFLVARRSPADRKIITTTALAFLAFVLLVGNKHDVYAILFYPFLVLMAAQTLVALIGPGERHNSSRAFAVALLILTLVSRTISYRRQTASRYGYDYYAVTDRIKTVLPPHARIMGLPNWWLGLTEYDYVSSLDLTYYHYYHGYSLVQGLQADRPDYMLVDSGWRGLLVDEGYFPPGPGFAIYRLPRMEFETFLAQRGKKVLEFSSQWHGTFEVYAIHWDKP